MFIYYTWALNSIINSAYACIYLHKLANGSVTVCSLAVP